MNRNRDLTEIETSVSFGLAALTDIYLTDIYLTDIILAGADEYKKCTNTSPVQSPIRNSTRYGVHENCSAGFIGQLQSHCP